MAADGEAGIMRAWTQRWARRSSIGKALAIAGCRSHGKLCRMVGFARGNFVVGCWLRDLGERILSCGWAVPEFSQRFRTQGVGWEDSLPYHERIVLGSSIRQGKRRPGGVYVVCMCSLDFVILLFTYLQRSHATNSYASSRHSNEPTADRRMHTCPVYLPAAEPDT